MNTHKPQQAKIIDINCTKTQKDTSGMGQTALFSCFSDLNDLDNLLETYFSDIEEEELEP